jgi:hypothetical protein
MVMSKRQDQSPNIVETDFFISQDDPESEMVSVGFLERSMVMEFDYEEFLEFAEVVDQIRDYINRAHKTRSTLPNGHDANGRA